MNIIKVLERMTGMDCGWTAKEIEAAVEKIRIHRESRERIASANMQAMLSFYSVGNAPPTIAEEAVAWADALIEELNK